MLHSFLSLIALFLPNLFLFKHSLWTMSYNGGAGLGRGEGWLLWQPLPYTAAGNILKGFDYLI